MVPLLRRLLVLVLLMLLAMVWCLWPVSAHTGLPLFMLDQCSSEADNSSSLAWGDYDSDGDLDLAVGSVGAPLRLYRNQGGRLTPDATWPAAVSFDTRDLAWADYDGDGDLDLAVANAGQPNHIYSNHDGVLGSSPTWSSPNAAPSSSLAWGDYDGDGDLDLAVGNDGQANHLYVNQDGKISLDAAWSSAASDPTRDLAWADFDGDGDLDLAVANYLDYSQIFRNEGGVLSRAAVWSSMEKVPATALAWGDYDGDGDPDLAVANHREPARIYRNDGGSLTVEAAWSSVEEDNSQGLAWGDFDSDGDLDLVVANDGDPLRLYVNIEGALSAVAAWSSGSEDQTHDVAWGDFDNDGSLDLVTANHNQSDRFYRNLAVAVTSNPAWSSASSRASSSLAWGDFDGDGDLDLAVGNHNGQANQLYRNQGQGLAAVPDWSSLEADDTSSLAWADYDGDGDLDLAVGNLGQANRLYQNRDGMLADRAIWMSSERDQTLGLAWADYDGDGDKDLAVANASGPNRLYANDRGTLAESSAWQSDEVEDSTCVAWADPDRDGDLDLVVGNDNGPVRFYENLGGSLKGSASWSSAEIGTVTDLAWGDYDGDGDQDLAVANQGQPNRLYRNENGTLAAVAAWVSAEPDSTTALDWGDFDGDGDLDLAAGNVDHPDRMYRNDKGVLTASAAWSTDAALATRDLAWGDFDGDGDLDLAAGADRIRFYRNQRGEAVVVGNQPPSASIHQAGSLADSDPVSSAEIGGPNLVPISYALFDPEGDSVAYVRASYSTDGGGHWLPATAARGVSTSQLAASPYPNGTLHTFVWDVYADGLSGRLDNVVFRIQAYSDLNASTAGPYQWASASTTSFPFGVQGTQIRVLNEMTPVRGAMVYRLPAGETGGGQLMADARGISLRTDALGYLAGRGEIEPGDRLLALEPVDWTDSLSWAAGLNATVHLFFSNGKPTETGLDVFSVDEPGIQNLTVSESHPVVLFDLDVSLEWDAHSDPDYLRALEADLKRASSFLYDFTDGQAALGQVTVHQGAEAWAYSDVLIYSSNQMRPSAVQGGVVTVSTADLTRSDVVYESGQVRMGASWNRYGYAGQILGEDWPLALAHELSHYLFFLDDVYLGLDEDGRLIPLGSCVGSVMGDMYDPSALNTEYLDGEQWLAPSSECGQTLSNVTLDRSEWDTVSLWYPWLKPGANPGPDTMPFELTTVNILDPVTPTETLEDPTFYIDYAHSEARSGEAKAFLIQNDDRVVDLGSPVSSQNRLLARGATEGDRLCVFDLVSRQYGCEFVSADDEHLDLEKDENWAPSVVVVPVDGRTIDVRIGGLAEGLALKARLYPENGEASQVLDLGWGDGSYWGTFVLPAPMAVGYAQVWVEEIDSENDPRRELIVGFTINGRLAAEEAAVPVQGSEIERGGNPVSRSSGPAHRGGGAPMPMIYYSDSPMAIRAGDFYSIQSTSDSPALPSGHTLVGQGYQLVSSPNARLDQGSVGIEYLESDLVMAGVSGYDLAIFHWNGSSWTCLETVVDSYYQLATAASQGAGTYVLAATDPGHSHLCPNPPEIPYQYEEYSNRSGEPEFP